MAVRIHVPWGLLSTVLGFAVLGGAVAYWLTTDVHGYLYRQCLLQAIGAALLGVVAWIASERISYRANLNTSPFLRQTTNSPAGKEAGEFDTNRDTGLSNITAVKKGCWVAYSIEVKANEKFFVDVQVEASFEGKRVDLLMFDVPNFLTYKDKDSATLPQNSLDTRCSEINLSASKHCEVTAVKSGTLYIVIDNKDRPVLTPSEGPVKFHFAAKMPWPTTSIIDVKLVPYLVGAAVAAIVLVVAIWYLGRRAEKSY